MCDSLTEPDPSRDLVDPFVGSKRIDIESVAREVQGHWARWRQVLH